MRRVTYILFLTIYPILTFGQYLMDAESDLKHNKVKRLTVYNCIDSTDCIRDVYEYNRQGQLTKFMPGIVNLYEQNDYYANRKLKTLYVKYHCCKDDTMYSAEHYFYNKRGKFKYSIKDQFENGKKIKTDTLFENADTKPTQLDVKKNKKGEVVEQNVGVILFPCAIEYKGKHRIVYFYKPNGLFENAQVFDETDKLILNFNYNYEFY